MAQTKPMDTTALAEKAQTGKNKEIYQLLERTQTYRIGVVARANLPNDVSFHIEVIIRLSNGNGEVNLPRLERTIACLKALKDRGYSLTYEDGNCISCETTKPLSNPPEEYLNIDSLLKKIT